MPRKRRKDAETMRDRYLIKKYGITSVQYREMEDSQDGVCAMCGDPETAIQGGRVRKLAVDHCHATGKIRALLCCRCNVGIAMFDDDPDKLVRAISYLLVHGEPSC